jgi:hypothetical protein
MNYSYNEVSAVDFKSMEEKTRSTLYFVIILPILSDSSVRLFFDHTILSTI